MIRPILPLVAVLALFSGCKTPKASTAPRQSAPSYVYNAPSKKELNHRVAELQKHGYTQADATQKAKTEFASKAWQPDTSVSTENWAYEKARQARSEANEKMEKDLAKLERR